MRRCSKVEVVRALAPELVRPMSRLCAVILQASTQLDEVVVFLFEDGRLRGPAGFSTLGMRIQNEQSGSSSLFPQPMALEPIPEETGNEGTREQGNEGTTGVGAPAGNFAPAKLSRGLLEARLESALSALARASSPSATVRQGHMALLKRWYYRPEARREGEIFFPDAEGRWPMKAILRGVGRVAAKSAGCV